MVIILSNIRSLHNVGSIFRTADGAGLEKIYLCGVTPAPVDRFGKPRLQFTKVSLGAEEGIVWEKKVSVIHLIKHLKKEGWEAVAVEQSAGSVPYYKFKSSKKSLAKTALIFGSETKGLSSAVLNQADRILEIPMKGKKESLNVSVAFGIVVFHLISAAKAL